MQMKLIKFYANVQINIRTVFIH